MRETHQNQNSVITGGFPVTLHNKREDKIPPLTYFNKN